MSLAGPQPGSSDPAQEDAWREYLDTPVAGRAQQRFVATDDDTAVTRDGAGHKHVVRRIGADGLGQGWGIHHPRMDSQEFQGRAWIDSRGQWGQRNSGTSGWRPTCATGSSITSRIATGCPGIGDNGDREIVANSLQA